MGKHLGGFAGLASATSARADLGSNSRLSSRLLWLLEFSKENAGLCQLVGLL